MPTLELIIQRKVENGYPVVAHLARPGDLVPSRYEQTLLLDPAALEDQRYEPLAYGTTLGQAVFTGKIAAAFSQALAEECVRILLSVEAVDLRALHWHRLAAPFDGGWRFLAVQQNTPFSFDIPTPASARFPTIGKHDLRALVLVAGPELLAGNYRLDRFNVPGTIGHIRGSLGEIPSTILDPPSLSNLSVALTTTQYTILHIVCHGLVNESGETVLYFPKDEHGSPVRAGELIETLASIRNIPHFIFLSVCDSANPRSENGLGGLAQRLVRQLGLPAVLAMTDRISVDTAARISARFYARLQEHGEADRALSESLAGLRDQPDLTVPALFSSLSGYSLFRDTLERNFTNREVDLGLARLSETLAVRAPILQPDLERLVQQPHFLTGEENTAAWQARVDTLRAIDAICVEALDLPFKLLCARRDPPPYDSRSPFRGLEAFRPEDAEFFFGRDALISRLIQKLDVHPFLAVLGASGSGKSSLVMAGLVPALEGVHSVFRPGAHPLDELENALRTGPGLLIVDQFEEVFTISAHVQRAEFLRRLLEQSGHRKVVLTIRADFLGEIALYKPLRDEIENHQIIVPPMNAQELRQAMDGQAGRVGLRFESDLSQQMLDDVEGEPGAMPLLQHALWSLWKRRHGRWLRADEYRAFGGVMQAIATTAEDLYTACNEAEQERIRDIFLRLTRLDDDTPSGAHRDTRRRILLGDLVPAGTDPATTTLLLDRLADVRLVVKTEIDVEVTHEALIRHWDRLRNWLNEDRDNLRLREGVAEDARRWEDAHQDESLLNHRGPRLDLALAMSRLPRYRLNRVEQAYLQACEALREREKALAARRRRLTITGVSIALVLIMAILVGWGVSSSNSARLLSFQVSTATVAQGLAVQNAATADSARSTAVNESHVRATAEANAVRQANIARAREISAQADTQRETQYDLSLLLAVKAFRTWENFQTTSILLQNLLAHPYLDQYLGTQGADITDLAFSLDGRWMASSEDKIIVIWDMSTRQPVGEPLSGHTDTIWSVAFSPDGSLLASASSDRSIILWDLKTHQPIGEPFGDPSDLPEALAFSPDGKILASAGSEKRITLWDVASHKQIGEPLQGHTMPVTSLAFSPDGTTLASGSWDETIILWDMKARQAAGQPLKGHTYWVNQVVYSPDGTKLASASSDNTVILWDVKTHRAIGAPLRGHTDSVFGVSFSPDGKLLASASYDKTVRLWDVESHQPVGEPLSAHTAQVSCVAFSPTGSLVVSGGFDRNIILWDLSRRLPVLRTFTSLNGSVNSLAYTPDGTRWISGSGDNTLTIWDQSSKQSKPISLTGHRGAITSLAVQPGGAILASGSKDATIRLWDLKTLQSLGGLLSGEDSPVTSLAFSPNGKTLAAGYENNAILLFDPAAGKLTRTLPSLHTWIITSLVFSPDGNLLASASQDNTIILWNSLTGQPVGEPIRGHTSWVSGLAFSPDGKILASASQDQTIRLWDVGTRQVIGQPMGGFGSINRVAFSGNGKILASANFDGSIVLWDVASQQPLGVPLTGNGGPVLSISFSPDGKTLASGSRDGVIDMWEVDPNAWLEKSCRRAGRNFSAAEWLHFFPEEAYPTSAPQAACPQWPLEPAPASNLPPASN